MPASFDGSEITPIAKFEIFRRAFERLNKYIENNELIAAFGLSFSILEDRTRSAFVKCSKKKNIPLKDIDVWKIPFSKIVKHLNQMGVIDKALTKRLLDAADLRNTLTHKMMWQLDVFSKEHALMIKNLINDVKAISRKFKSN